MTKLLAAIVFVLSVFQGARAQDSKPSPLRFVLAAKASDKNVIVEIYVENTSEEAVTIFDTIVPPWNTTYWFNFSIDDGKKMWSDVLSCSAGGVLTKRTFDPKLKTHWENIIVSRDGGYFPNYKAARGSHKITVAPSKMWTEVGQ